MVPAGFCVDGRLAEAVRGKRAPRQILQQPTHGTEPLSPADRSFSPAYRSSRPATIRTVWSLFNAFTEAPKGSLTLLPARTQALRGLLDMHVGQLLPRPEGSAETHVELAA